MGLPGYVSWSEMLLLSTPFPFPQLVCPSSTFLRVPCLATAVTKAAFSEVNPAAWDYILQNGAMLELWFYVILEQLRGLTQQRKFAAFF